MALRTHLSALVFALIAVAASASISISIHGVDFPAWFPALFNGALIGIGVVELFLGYRIFKVTLFVLGFIGAGPVLALLTLDGTHNKWAGIAVGVVAGLLVGGTGAAVPKIGVFLVGATLGLVAGECLRLTVLAHLHATIALGAFIASTVVLGLGFGILGIFLMRPTVIVATSVIGSFAMFRGLSMLLIPLGVTMLPTTEEQVKNGITNSAAVWGSIAGIGVLALVGAFVQFRYTSRKRGGDEKDKWETEVEESEVSLAALTGGSEGKKEKKGKKKGKKSGKKKSRAAGVDADALLRDQEEGGEFYEPAGAGDEYLDADGYYGGAGDDDWEASGVAAAAPPPQAAKASWWGGRSKAPQQQQQQQQHQEVEW